MALWIDQPATEHDEASKELVELLTEVLRLPQEAREAIEEVPDIDLGDVAWPVPFRARRFWTQNVLDLRRKAALKQLIENMAERFPPRRDDFVRFLELRSVEGGGWYAIDHPLQAQFVGAGSARPLVNRSELRRFLGMLAEQGFRTLNILGPSASGKSFSLQLIQVLAEHQGASVLPVDVADWGTSPFDAVSLVEAFALQLNIDVDTSVVDNAPDPHTRARLLVYALRGAFPASETVRWIVIDGLDRANVQADALAFVERLLKSVDEDGSPPNVRLVVTGFDGILPEQSRVEHIRSITRDDVWALFEVASRQLAWTVTEAQLQEWTNEAVAAHEASEGDLRELGTSIYRIFRRHLDEGPGA